MTKEGWIHGYASVRSRPTPSEGAPGRHGPTQRAAPARRRHRAVLPGGHAPDEPTGPRDRTGPEAMARGIGEPGADAGPPLRADPGRLRSLRGPMMNTETVNPSMENEQLPFVGSMLQYHEPDPRGQRLV